MSTQGNMAASKYSVKPSWTRLDREQAHEVLDRLSGNADAAVFSKEATEVSWRNLPFYNNYKL